MLSCLCDQKWLASASSRGVYPITCFCRYMTASLSFQTLSHVCWARASSLWAGCRLRPPHITAQLPAIQPVAQMDQADFDTGSCSPRTCAFRACRRERPGHGPPTLKRVDALPALSPSAFSQTCQFCAPFDHVSNVRRTLLGRKPRRVHIFADSTVQQ